MKNTTKQAQTTHKERETEIYEVRQDRLHPRGRRERSIEESHKYEEYNFSHSHKPSLIPHKWVQVPYLLFIDNRRKSLTCLLLCATDNNP